MGLRGRRVLRRCQRLPHAVLRFSAFAGMCGCAPSARAHPVALYVRALGHLDQQGWSPALAATLGTFLAAAGCDTVQFTLANEVYAWSLPLWVARMQVLQVSPPPSPPRACVYPMVVVAIDEAARVACRSLPHEYRAVCLHPPREGGFAGLTRAQVQLRVGMLKYDTAAQLVSLGLSVLFAEQDVFPVRSLWPFIESPSPPRVGAGRYGARRRRCCRRGEWSQTDACAVDLLAKADELSACVAAGKRRAD
eukprot:gene52357-55307_t